MYQSSSKQKYNKTVFQVDGQLLPSNGKILKNQILSNIQFLKEIISDMHCFLLEESTHVTFRIVTVSIFSDV